MYVHLLNRFSVGFLEHLLKAFKKIKIRIPSPLTQKSEESDEIIIARKLVHTSVIHARTDVEICMSSVSQSPLPV